MKRPILLLLLIVISAIVTAQTRRVSGVITDQESKEAIMQVTVQLLKKDSSFVAGALSDENGKFSLQAPKNGSYLLKFTSIGYTTLVKDIAISNDKNTDLGRVMMKADAIMLSGVTATAQASKVTVKKDTFIYNAAAYRTPEGSVVEELVKKLPGAEIDDAGKITINGKEVKKILVGGKEFMTGDTQTAMKNLPTSIINDIKAYDQKSDLARVTGIEDGEEETVLDFGIKPGMNKGMFSNIDLAAGTESRYAERLMGAYFNDNYKIMGFGNANNTSDRGFPGGGGGGRWGNRSGLNASKMAGVNFNYDDSKYLQLDASLRWNHRDGDVWSKQAAESFIGTTSSFSNSINQNYTRGNSWDARIRMEWKPDTLTNIMFRPRFNVSTNDGNQNSISATFDQDPYLYITDPLATASIQELINDSIVVNTRKSGSISYSDNTTGNAMLQINRRLNNMGRNITVRGNINFGDSESKTLSTSEVAYYQSIIQNDSIYRYNLTPTKNWGYSLQATYSEPLWRRTYLQFSYQFRYSYNKSDRSTYDFSPVANLLGNVKQDYRGWGNYLSLLPSDYTLYLDDDLSRYSEYKNYIHEINVMFRLIRDNYRLNAGIMVQPQKSKFIQDYQNVYTDTVRNVTNITPTLDFRFNPNDLTELRLEYRGTTSQPSMSQLLDITDDSNPLNITKGNPGLKPSFNNNFSFRYNTYIMSHQRAIMSFANFSTTRNAISNMVTYNKTTGGQTTRPENINGNWNANFGFMFNTAIDSAGVWNINTFSMINHNNSVGYLLPSGSTSSVKNTTRNTMFMERLQGSYRKSWFEFAIDGNITYNHARNELQSQNNLDTWQFSYGGSINIFAPWGTSLSTDIHNQNRRGYNDNSMNTNELIWNAQISQSMLRGNALTISLQFYDILQKMSNYSRSVNSMQRSDTEYNSINSYVMLHAIYRLNIFGGKEARDKMFRGGPGNRRGGFGGRPGGFGGRPGGFGGRR